MLRIDVSIESPRKRRDFSLCGGATEEGLSRCGRHSSRPGSATKDPRVGAAQIKRFPRGSERGPVSVAIAAPIVGR